MAKPPPILVEYEISPEAWAAFLMTGASRMTIKIPEPNRPKPQKRLMNGAAAHAAAPLLLEGPKKSTRTGSALVLLYLAEHKTRPVTNTELNKHISEQGLSIGAVSVAMTGFLKKGYVERVSKGTYRILKEGLEKVNEKPAKAKPNKKVTGRALLWAELQKGQPCKSVELGKLLPNPSSISSALVFFREKGLIAKIAPGLYQITAKGKKNG